MKRITSEIWVFYKGMDLDDEIRKAARKHDDGSGMEMRTGLRDLSFSYPDVRSGRLAHKRIRAIGKRIRKIEFITRETER